MSESEGEFIHWGEIVNQNDEMFIPDVTADIERSMNKFCLAEFDTEYTDTENVEQLILQPMDPLMLYSIALHKHINDMTEMIRVAELARESNVLPPKVSVLVMPELPKIVQKHRRNNLNFIEQTPTLTDLDVPELSENVGKKILQKCVATMFAHIGFETTHQSVLDFVTDVLEDFFKKVTNHLTIAQEDEESGLHSSFPNVIERVLIELGLGGVRALHDYYQTRIIKYIAVLQTKCYELNNRYENLLIPKSSSPTDKGNKIVRVKMEEEDAVEVENPEVHFPAIDGDVGLSSLETGFQLLNSLEAEANLHSLGESEEDLNVNISPGVVSISENDLPNLSPYMKKKRLK